MSVLTAIAERITQRRDQFSRPGIVDPAGLQSMTWSGVVLDQLAASKIIAVHACWGLLADSAGLLPPDTYIRDGLARIEIEKPDWLLQPMPLDPSITTGEHFSQVVVSMVSDGTAFILALPEANFYAASLEVLEPTRIHVTRDRLGPRYEYSMEGGGREYLRSDQIIQVTRLRRPGALRGLSPIDESAQSLGKVRAADQFGGRFFANGMNVVGSLTVPGPLDKNQTEALRDELTKTYGSVANANKPGIFANGATFSYPEMDIQRLQLLELLRWGVLDVARLYHVPPHLAGDNAPGSVSYQSVEQQAIEYVMHGVRPYVIKIEQAYGRLLPGAETFLSFNLDALVRGDLKTRAEAIALELQSKQLTLDEARALENRAPYATFTEEDLNGPGGLLQTPNNNFLHVTERIDATAAPKPGT
jgi:HK97 family phage portal protein